MVLAHHGPIRDLRDAVRAERYLWLFCRRCGHVQRRDPRRLATLAGRNLSFAELVPRLACKRCGRRGCAAVLASDERLIGRND
jgi:hypothetical protein